MTEPLTVLGGITAEQFLAEYWQKKPLLVRNGLPEIIGLLQPQDVQELLKGGGAKSTGLITSSGGNTCDESSDLSLVSIVVKSPDKCVKVEASNSGSKQTLSATFTVTQSKCSKSHLVAIIVPSVVGAIVILSVIAVIVFLKIRPDKKP